MFTFATITYNHEKHIVEHLESIKYQITNFGQEESFSLIVSDDASNDNTINLIENWLKENRHLFVDVKLFKSDNNKGIAKNYTRAVMAIETDNFKVLSGDDLYFKNNILNVIRDYDIVISPTISFSDKIISDISLSTLILMKYCDPLSIKKLLEYKNFIIAPGVFIKRSLAQDDGLLNFLKQISWVEDYAKWYYLFRHKRSLKVFYEKQAKVLYRIDSGVSTNEAHTKRSEFKKEEKQLFKEWALKNYRYPEYINPYSYYLKFILLKVKYIDSKTDKELMSKISTYNHEVQTANQYLSLIKEEASRFKK